VFLGGRKRRKERINGRMWGFGGEREGERTSRKERMGARMCVFGEREREKKREGKRE
jgi:hypothetical protein